MTSKYLYDLFADMNKALDEFDKNQNRETYDKVDKAVEKYKSNMYQLKMYIERSVLKATTQRINKFYEENTHEEEENTHEEEGGGRRRTKHKRRKVAKKSKKSRRSKKSKKSRKSKTSRRR
jgi:hypothetical protein